MHASGRASNWPSFGSAVACRCFGLPIVSGLSCSRVGCRVACRGACRRGPGCCSHASSGGRASGCGLPACASAALGKVVGVFGGLDDSLTRDEARRASNLSVAYTTHLLWWWVNAAEAFGLDFLFFVSLFVL